MRSSRAAEIAGVAAALGLWTALVLGPVADTLSPRPASSPAGAATPLSAPAPVTRPVRPRTIPARASAGVAGRVLDASGRPVAGAVIVIQELASETPVGWLRVITDAAGNFRIGGLLPGFYSLVALHEVLDSTSGMERLPLLADATARVLLVLSEPITI